MSKLPHLFVVSLFHSSMCSLFNLIRTHLIHVQYPLLLCNKCHFLYDKFPVVSDKCSFPLQMSVQFNYDKCPFPMCSVFLLVLCSEILLLISAPFKSDKKKILLRLNSASLLSCAILLLSNHPFFTYDDLIKVSKIAIYLAPREST